MILLIAGIIGLGTVALFLMTAYAANQGKGSMANAFMVLVIGGALSVGIAIGYPSENPLSDLLIF